MKKKIFIIGLIILFLETGCAFERDSDIASHNVSKEADSFRVKRRITFINLRSTYQKFYITFQCLVIYLDL